MLTTFSRRVELEYDQAAVVWVDLGAIPDREARTRAGEIRDAIVDDTLFFPAVGLASGKFAARIAAVTAGDGGVRLVPAGDEKAFLSPFPVARLALTRKQAEQFKLLGIETLGQLAALPASAVQAQFGKVGKQLHGLANGTDLRPVAIYSPRLNEQRSHTFEPGVEERQVLEAVLRRLVDDLAACMAAKGLTTQEVMLTVRTDRKEVLEERSIPREPLAGHISLYTHLWRLLEKMRIPSAVVQIEVEIADLAPLLPRQLDFLGQMFPDARNVTEIVDYLLPRYGPEPLQQVDLNPHQGIIPERSFRFRGAAS
jgi:nucleotidyltransferase/DNA polymerase involved in DNA repair